MSIPLAVRLCESDDNQQDYGAKSKTENPPIASSFSVLLFSDGLEPPWELHLPRFIGAAFGTHL